MHNIHSEILVVHICNSTVVMILNACMDCNVTIDQSRFDLMKYKWKRRCESHRYHVFPVRTLAERPVVYSFTLSPDFFPSGGSTWVCLTAVRVIRGEYALPSGRRVEYAGTGAYWCSLTL